MRQQTLTKVNSDTAAHTTKDFFVKKVADKLPVIGDKIITSDIIDAVICHQFESASKAINECNSLEFSGFGKFIFNVNKAHKQMEKYRQFLMACDAKVNSPETSDNERRNLQVKIASTISNMKSLKQKLKNSDSNE